MHEKVYDVPTGPVEEHPERGVFTPLVMVPIVIVIATLTLAVAFPVNVTLVEV